MKPYLKIDSSFEHFCIINRFCCKKTRIRWKTVVITPIRKIISIISPGFNLKLSNWFFVISWTHFYSIPHIISVSKMIQTMGSFEKWQSICDGRLLKKKIQKFKFYTTRLIKVSYNLLIIKVFPFSVQSVKKILYTKDITGQRILGVILKLKQS